MCKPIDTPRDPSVLLITNRLGTYNGDTGGGSIMRERLVAELSKHGYQTRVFASGMGKSPPDVCDTVRGPMLPLTWRNVSLLRGAMQSCSLIVVSGSYTPMSLVGSLMARLQGSRVLYICTTNATKAAESSFEGWRLGVAKRLFEMNDVFISKLAHRVYTRSHVFLEELKARGLSHLRGVMVQRDQYRKFYPVSQGTHDQEIADARAWLCGGEETKTTKGVQQPVLLYAGRLMPEKRLPLLIANKPKNCVLAMVGGGTEEHIAELKEMARNRDDVIIRAGRVSQDRLRVLYWAADVHVSASDFETLGNTVRESLLCGTPVVVQNAGGYVQQVVSQRQGFLVDFSRPEEVQSAVSRALNIETAAPAAHGDVADGIHIVESMIFEEPVSPTGSASCSPTSVGALEDDRDQGSGRALAKQDPNTKTPILGLDFFRSVSVWFTLNSLYELFCRVSHRPTIS